MQRTAILLLFSSVALSAQSIQYSESRKTWLITTSQSSYAMGVGADGALRNLYWGAPLWRIDDLAAPPQRRDISSFDPRQMLEAEVAGEYEAATGSLVVETLEAAGLSAAEMPAVLVASHGPFTWGADTLAAADNAIALEAVAAMASMTLELDPTVRPMSSFLAERHYRRKHGPAAYYGQPRR
jgi:ribulose-5-phosphate 4-epimerase/fuculose-1-phosphate aldolase